MKEYGIGGYDKQVDVFSYGIVLWEIVTREKQNPLTGLFEDAYKQRVLHGPMPALPEDLDPNLATLITQCWQYAPDARPSFSELISSLETLVTQRHSALEPLP